MVCLSCPGLLCTECVCGKQIILPFRVQGDRLEGDTSGLMEKPMRHLDFGMNAENDPHLRHVS